jgi:hypothetical protein
MDGVTKKNKHKQTRKQENKKGIRKQKKAAKKQNIQM